MKRAIAAAVVLAILISVSVLEVVYVDDRLTSLKNETLALYQNMERDKENIDTPLNK
jgi:hypothetical protein